MAAEKKSKVQCTTRGVILRAARRVIINQGVEAMTLEAVAREAEVSKGGLLYHFPNKEALIVGMLSQLVDKKRANLQREFDQDDTPDVPGRSVRAFVRAASVLDQEEVTLAFSLLAAISFNPELLKPVREMMQDWQQQMEASGLPRERVTLIRMAIDGLHFSNMFGFDPPDEPLRTKVLEVLLELAKPGCDAN